MSQSYQALVEDKIFLGGAKDVEQMVKNEGIDVVVDLREEAEECAFSEAKVEWIKVPLGDNATEPQENLFQTAIQEVVKAYRDGKKVAFHCGGGKGRTGTVAVGVLRDLGIANSLEEAGKKAKAIRPIIAVKPDQWEALRKIYK